MRLSARCLLTVLATAVAMSAHAQGDLQAGSGELAVTVRESGGGALLPDVRITATRSGSPAVTGTTTDDGTLRLTLTPGHYTIYAHSPEHLTGSGYPSVGLAAPPPPPLQPDGEAVAHKTGIIALRIRRNGQHRVLFELARASSLQGFVLSEDERPLPDVDVELHRVVHAAGEPVLSQSGTGKTSALGHFRITAMRPGDYVVRVRFGAAHRSLYNDSYYPGVSNLANAIPVTIRSGHDEALRFTTPLLPLGSITGIVTGPASVVSRIELTYQRLGESTGCVIVHMMVPVGADGRFNVSGLTSGRYALRAEERTGGGSPPRYAAVRIVDVGPAPLTDVNVPMQSYATLRGRFEFHGTSPKPTHRSVSVQPAGPDAAARWHLSSAYVEMPGDEFGLERIFGRNRLAVSVPDGWIVEAVVLADGTDVYDTPYAFEPGKHYSDVRVVLSDRTATLKGRVAGAPTPLPAPGMMVVAVPEDETAGPSRPHRVPSGSVQDDQSFLIPDLRPGRTYLVAAYAWPASAEGDAWYVQHARSATRIHVTGPGVHTVDVRPAR